MSFPRHANVCRLFCVLAPAVAAAPPMRRLSLWALASRRGGRSEDPRGAALAPGGAGHPIPRFAPDAPVGEQMAQAQVVGQVQQRHLVPEMGPHPFLPPPLHGVGIGPEAAGDLRPRQVRLLLEAHQALRGSRRGRRRFFCCGVSAVSASSRSFRRSSPGPSPARASRPSRYPVRRAAAEAHASAAGCPAPPTPGTIGYERNAARPYFHLRQGCVARSRRRPRP